jgi:ribosome-associated toxin RatA of RatAB toxin-antitoxin module
MRTVKRSAIVPFSAAQMFHLVNDIESYPLYLPWCRDAIILSRTPNEVRAQLHIARGGLRHSFSTLNRLHEHHQIEVNLLEGPFRHLKGLWNFEDKKEGGSFVSIDLEFLLSNRLLDLALGPVLEGIAGDFIQAFCHRAQDIYGQQ